MGQGIASPFIHTVIIRPTNDVATRYSRLEPDEPRGSRPVLRGLGRSNAPRLPDRRNAEGAAVHSKSLTQTKALGVIAIYLRRSRGIQTGANIRREHARPRSMPRRSDTAERCVAWARSSGMDSPPACNAAAKGAGGGASEAATCDASLAIKRLSKGKCQITYWLL